MTLALRVRLICTPLWLLFGLMLWVSPGGLVTAAFICLCRLLHAAVYDTLARPLGWHHRVPVRGVGR